MATIELTIDKLVLGGAGIGRFNNTVVFVPHSAPGDRLRVSIRARKRNYWQGRLEQVIEPSPLRTEPGCPLYAECGGCDLQHISYESQLVVKKLIVNEALQRIGRVYVPPGNPLAVRPPWNYRNKSQYPVAGPTAPGEAWRVGFYRRNSHQVVDVPACPIEPPGFDRTRAVLRTGLAESGESAYDETTGTGNLRYIALRHGTAFGEQLLTIVTRTEQLEPRVLRQLEAEFPGLVGVILNPNPGPGNRIAGERFIELAGRGWYQERLLDLVLRVSAGSFFQANTAVTELVVRRVLKYLEPEPGMTVVDAHCGIGTFALPVSRFVSRVIGAEVNPYAVADARFNAGQNSVANFEIRECPAEKLVAGLARVDAVILDPPRRGCSPELLAGIAQLRPGRLVYVSCNPATLARDLVLLRNLGYEATEVQLADMFPQTAHIETIVKLVPQSSFPSKDPNPGAIPRGMVN